MGKLHTKQFIVRFLVVVTIMIVVLCKYLSWNEMRIQNVSIENIPELSSDQGALLNVDNAYYEDQKLIVNGWCVIRGRVTNPVSIHVLIRERNIGECYELPTAMVAREDVTACFDENINYDNSGFSVNVNCKKFDFENSIYEVMLRYKIGDEEYIIKSNNIIDTKTEGISE